MSKSFRLDSGESGGMIFFSFSLGAFAARAFAERAANAAFVAASLTSSLLIHSWPSMGASLGACLTSSAVPQSSSASCTLAAMARRVTVNSSCLAGAAFMAASLVAIMRARAIFLALSSSSFRLARFSGALFDADVLVAVAVAGAELDASALAFAMASAAAALLLMAAAAAAAADAAIAASDGFDGGGTVVVEVVVSAVVAVVAVVVDVVVTVVAVAAVVVAADCIDVSAAGMAAGGVAVAGVVAGVVSMSSALNMSSADAAVDVVAVVVESVVAVVVVVVDAVLGANEIGLNVNDVLFLIVGFGVGVADTRDSPSIFAFFGSCWFSGARPPAVRYV